MNTYFESTGNADRPSYRDAINGFTIKRTATGDEGHVPGEAWQLHEDAIEFTADGTHVHDADGEANARLAGSGKTKTEMVERADKIVQDRIRLRMVGRIIPATFKEVIESHPRLRRRGLSSEPTSEVLRKIVSLLDGFASHGEAVIPATSNVRARNVVSFGLDVEINVDFKGWSRDSGDWIESIADVYWVVAQDEHECLDREEWNRMVRSYVWQRGWYLSPIEVKVSFGSQGSISARRAMVKADLIAKAAAVAATIEEMTEGNRFYVNDQAIAEVRADAIERYREAHGEDSI